MEPQLLRITCPECGWVGHYTIDDLEKTLKKAKIDKAMVVANQLHKRQGFFYDRWKAAMEARGEQKRCKECAYFEWGLYPDDMCTFHAHEKSASPSWFACNRFEPTIGE